MCSLPVRPPINHWTARVTYPISPPPSKPPSPRILPAKPPRRQPVASSSRSSIETHDRAALKRERSDRVTSTLSAASSSQCSLEGKVRADTGLPSPPSSRITSSSSTSFLGLYPGIEEKLNYAAHVQKEKETAGKKKQIKHRQHIYHNQVRELGSTRECLLMYLDPVQGRCQERAKENAGRDGERAL